METDDISVEFPTFVCGLEEKRRLQSTAAEDDSDGLQHSVLWSTVHHRVIAVDNDQRLSCWDSPINKAEKKAKCQSVEAHEEWVSSLTLSPDATTVVTGSYDYELAVWKLPEPASRSRDDITLQCRLRGHKDYVTSLALSNSGDVLFSAAEDGHVLQWDLATASCVYQWPEPAKAITAMMFSANENFLFIGGIDSHPQYQPRTSPVPTSPFARNSSPATSAQSSPERTDFSLIPQDSRRKIMAYAEAMWKSSRMHSGDKFSHAPMQQLLGNSEGWEVMVWDVGQREVRHRFPSASCIGSMALSKDGKKLYVANEEEVLLWELDFDEHRDFLPVAKLPNQPRRLQGCHIVKAASEINRIFTLARNNLNTILIINVDHDEVMFSLPLFVHHTLPYPGNYCFDISPNGNEIVFIDGKDVVIASILFPSPSDGTSCKTDFDEYKKGDVVIRRRRPGGGRAATGSWWHFFICR